MTLIQTLLRRLLTQPSFSVAAKGPVPLQADLMKAVAGGGGGGDEIDSPRGSW